MATYLAFHEVDDVDHWLSSPKREEVFGPLGITARTFQDPQGSKRVGMIVEIPDFAAFQEFMQTEPAAEAMKHDGVHPGHSRDSRRGIGPEPAAFRPDTQAAERRRWTDCRSEAVLQSRETSANACGGWIRSLRVAAVRASRAAAAASRCRCA
jgi:hypothetical protein